MKSEIDRKNKLKITTEHYCSVDCNVHELHVILTGCIYLLSLCSIIVA